ncbi:uncharacterized protein LOC133872635 [Alnus glutinosa]|uniref:uncharacterized protein LOC133872635 n=1 Tax=Alnus glutinosa TaxID=3517 RepID=UPI002D7722F3|nr:uncharacterized protein LOC133872635 [Alnus glutinosa]XP_062166201.1 uncharacterized protein LOC133872635 [Alnus glutinosa]
MADPPIDKIAISGPTLASLIQRFSSSSGPLDGLLFGHVALLSPSTLSDDDPSSSTTTATTSTSQTLIATITSFLSLPFSSPSGHLLPSFPSSPSPLGWFSARRRSPLRPSMREFSVSQSLSSSSTPLSPCLFLLLASPIHDHAIHTHEYRAYQFRASSESFDPKCIDIVNIGPGFRGHYGAFSPNSPFPALPCEVGGSVMVEDEKEGGEGELEERRQLDLCAEGFEVRRLRRLIGSGAADYTAELEDLYEKMLAKVESLARQVELSSAKVFEQENHNRKLRHKAARLAGSE